MKQTLKKYAVLLLGCATAVTAFAKTDDRPNIIFILADDLGLGDVSYHARNIQKTEPIFETPTMDRLAKEGMWFTDGHSATALCAPTRYAVMSGNNNYRSYLPWGVWSAFGETAFKPGEATLGSVVNDAGYYTGFIGKWHLGGDFYEKGSQTKMYRGAKNGNIVDQVDMTQFAGSGPKYCGFDYDFTSPCGIQGPIYILYENEQWYPWADDSEIIYFTKDVAIHPKDLDSKGDGPGDSNWDSRELGDKLSAKAVEFVKSGAEKDEPFFLYYCSPMVHRPHCPPDTFDGQQIKGSTPSEHLDMAIELDLQIKRIVDALKETGEYENTLIVLSSDNGGLLDREATEKAGYHPSGGWNGSKNSPLEGGHRVPTVVWWPGHVEPGICEELVVNQDMVATFAALVGTEIPEGQAQDSNNILPLVLNEDGFKKREYWVNQSGSQNELMIRNMPWKLIIQSNHPRTKFEPKALYHLEKDPVEANNLIEDPKYKAKAAELLKEYMDVMQSGRSTAPGRM